METFNYYLLVFILVSFLGFIVETIWCVIKNKKIESRKGLIYSFLIPIYGIACLFITLFINYFELVSNVQIFLLGIVISTIVEYISSVIQEKVFNSKSWDYSDIKFNLNGRVNLLYSIMFGFVTLLWNNGILNNFNNFIINVNMNDLSYLCAFLTIFILYDIIISSIACYRMKERKNNIERNNKFWKYIDKKYDDNRLKRVYANMNFI